MTWDLEEDFHTMGDDGVSEDDLGDDLGLDDDNKEDDGIEIGKEDLDDGLMEENY